MVAVIRKLQTHAIKAGATNLSRVSWGSTGAISFTPPFEPSDRVDLLVPKRLLDQETLRLSATASRFLLLNQDDEVERKKENQQL